MKNNVIILFLGVMLSTVGCSTEPDLSLVDYQPKMVIDGWIETGGYPVVILGKSISYFDQIDSATVRQLVVTTAKVTVSDGEKSEVLTLRKDDNYFPPYIYTATSLKGELGKTYNLKVEHQGKTYTASTTIPAPAVFKELWFETVEGEDSLGYIYGKFDDDPASENFYRIFTQRLTKDSKFIPVYLSAISDQSFNGKNFTFSLLRGPDNYSNVVDDLYFTKGDTVRVKLCTMDRQHFDFWRTLERELYVIGNPFASSGNEILSNIDGDSALGVWGGYGVTYHRVIAREK